MYFVVIGSICISKFSVFRAESEYRHENLNFKNFGKCPFFCHCEIQLGGPSEEVPREREIKFKMKNKHDDDDFFFYSNSSSKTWAYFYLKDSGQNHDNGITTYFRF